ncbi:KDEL motif-containing protein 1 [Trichinella sp. T6]|nr:KDEL motif-containing protein 1 [Trichinella sp. T6]
MMCKNTITYCFVLIVFSIFIVINSDLASVSVYGDGIRFPSLSLPLRHIFLQLVDENGQNITKPVDSNLFRILPSSLDSNCVVHDRLIDCYDGTYIYLFDIQASCANLAIDIQSPTGKSLLNPLLLEGPLHPEQCKCPIPIEEWFVKAKCEEFANLLSSLNESFLQWNKGAIEITKVLEEAYSMWGVHNRSHSYVHYKIRDNTIFRQTFGEYCDFKMFSDEMLVSISRKFIIPDMDFLLNLGDWPLMTMNHLKVVSPLPILSWCGSNNSLDIVLPTYEMMHSILRKGADNIFVAQGWRSISWEEKENKAFWRGRDSSKERLLLVNISRKYPDLLDAKLTHFFFFTDKVDVYGPPVHNIAMPKFFEFKYQISVDGTVAAYRLMYLLAGNSIILKQDSIYYEHFYPLLKPWVHYVPVKRDLSDLIDQIQWSMNHPEQVKTIIKNAQNFVNSYLTPRATYCYLADVFKKYAEILKKPLVNINSEKFERVPKTDSNVFCSCSNIAFRSDEL